MPLISLAWAMLCYFDAGLFCHWAHYFLDTLPFTFDCRYQRQCRRKYDHTILHIRLARDINERGYSRWAFRECHAATLTSRVDNSIGTFRHDAKKRRLS